MSAPTTTASTVLYGRPGFEGSNIRTWIGFKHFVYLVEQACLQWLRDQGHRARELYLERGLGFEIVDCSVQLPAVLELDDDVRAEATAARAGRLTVRLSVDRDGADLTVLRGKVTVALVRERSAAVHLPAPDHLAGLESADVADVGTGVRPRPYGAGGFRWSWRVPYFYCHYSDRVAHSGYVRALEEVVDRFLADRGLSVGRMLAERSWIPVVSRARVTVLAAAHMEETIDTVFTVGDVLRGVMFDGRMDCYVRRGDDVVPVASASILHGYAIAAGDGAGGLAQLDADVVRALTEDRS